MKTFGQRRPQVANEPSETLLHARLETLEQRLDALERRFRRVLWGQAATVVALLLLWGRL
jgi:hypothetical protein